MLTRAFELFSEHLTNWGLVWFGVIFWGSIINAALISFFGDTNNLVFINAALISFFGDTNNLVFKLLPYFLGLLPYFLGLLLGLMGKYKRWSWIN